MCLYRFWILFNTIQVILTNPDLNKSSAIHYYKPLILSKVDDAYWFPTKVKITPNKQYIEYFYSKDHDERYYCPDDGDTNKSQHSSNDIQLGYCLFEKKFKKGERKKCKNEAKPLILEETTHRRRNPRRMIADQSRRLYKFVYKVCANVSQLKQIWNNIRISSKNLSITNDQLPQTYEIYYDHTVNRVIYTKHQIMAPYIFRILRLDKERATLENISQKYSTETYGLENLNNLKKTLEGYIAQNPFSEDKEYELQMLVPTEDFALRHWMITTFHMINYAPQHKSKVSIWNAINSHVRQRLIERYNEQSVTKIYTGTWGQLKDADQNIVYLGNDQQAAVTIPQIWWKLIKYSNNFEIKTIVIIMHNVSTLEKICEEEDTACNITHWQWPVGLSENIFEMVYCCSVRSAQKSIQFIQDLDITVAADTNILKLG